MEKNKIKNKQDRNVHKDAQGFYFILFFLKKPRK